MSEYRCKETIDLEEILEMADQPKNIKAIIKWKSGREEILKGSILKGGNPDANFSSMLVKYQSFPTVLDVKVERY